MKTIKTIKILMLLGGWFAAAAVQGNPAKMSLSTKLLLQKQNKVSASPLQRSTGVSRQYHTLYVNTDATFDPQTLTAFDAVISRKTPTLFTVRLPVENIPALAEVQGVIFIDAGQKVKPLLDVAAPYISADKVWQVNAPLTQSYTGSGVVVGIIDFGIDLTHPAFYDSDGNSRIKRVWLQDDVALGNPPPAFTYGTEHTPEDLISKGIFTSNIAYSHGTHVTGIAAGGKSPYKGVAPNADIVFVELHSSAQTTYITEGIEYIFNYAQSVGKPAVVNISLGHHGGPHNGKSDFDRALDNIVGSGRVVVGAVGNEGNSRIHAQHTFTSHKDLRTAIEWDDNSGGCCAITSPAVNYEWAIEVWDKNIPKKVHTTSFFSTAKNEYLIDYIVPVLKDTITITASSLNANGNTSLSGFFNAYFTTTNTSKYRAVAVFRASTGILHVWNSHSLALSSLTAYASDSWLTPDNRSSAGEVGGTARKIISVGSYDIRVRVGNQLKLLSAINQKVSDFSSQGPTVDGRQKPDVIAPGSIIYSAVNSHDMIPPPQDFTFPVYDTDGSHSYDIMHGTSMSAPMVTGLVALMLEANPLLDADTIRGLLKKYAALDDAIRSTDKNRRGYGKIDAFSVLCNINDRQDLPLSVQILPSREKPLFSIAPNPSRGKFYLHFDETEQAQMRIYSIVGMLLRQQRVSPYQELLLEDLPVGIYLVELTVGGQRSTQKIMIY